MANESYLEKRNRIKEEQIKRKKQRDADKKMTGGLDDGKVKLKKSKSSKLGSGASSSGSKNPTSKFQDMKDKKKDNKSTPKSEKAYAAVMKMMKSKGKASANEMKRAGPVKKTASASSVKVKSGNTLSQIAKSKGITLKALLAANPSITNPNKISVGQNIKIPASDKDSVYKGMTKTEMAKMAMKNGGTTMKKKTKYMAKGGMKKTKYMAKGGATKKTKYMARGGAAKRK